MIPGCTAERVALDVQHMLYGTRDPETISWVVLCGLRCCVCVAIMGAALGLVPGFCVSVCCQPVIVL